MLSEKNSPIFPIVKWVGGKRQLLKEITSLVPQKINTYYEPFVGGGAVLFYLKPHHAIINDLNKELITTYNVVKNNPLELIESLKLRKNDENYFCNLRNIDLNKELFSSLSDVDKASRMLYLNKTCFNGLYRVNKSGHFNSPYGRYKRPNIVNEDGIMSVHQYFVDNDVKITNDDFETACCDAKEGDFVYFDPPYYPLTKTSNFTSYNSDGFDYDDQLRLKRLCDDLTRREVKWLLSNSYCDVILDLYKDYNIKVVQANRSINSDKNKRGKVNEVLISNY